MPAAIRSLLIPLFALLVLRGMSPWRSSPVKGPCGIAIEPGVSTGRRVNLRSQAAAALLRRRPRVPIHYPCGLASSSTPVPSVSVAWKAISPPSLIAAPLKGVEGVWANPGCGKTQAIVPTPGITVPVRATNFIERPEHMHSAVGLFGMPLLAVSMFHRAALRRGVHP